MSARTRASWRIVFALTLLLAAPAGVRAETAEPEVARVATLLQLAVDDLGQAPLTVTVSRIIFTPGASEPVDFLPGPRIVLVEAGALAFHATGNVSVIRAVAESIPGPTATPTLVPTPTPVRSPTTEVILNRGDVAPVPIWTMHSFRNDGSEPAVILDIRITAGDEPGLPTNLDVEMLAQETGLTTLPTGRASIVLGQSTVAPGGMVLAPRQDLYQLVADVGGSGPIEPAADGSVHNRGATALGVYVLAIARVGEAGRRQPAQAVTGPGGADVAFDRVAGTHFGSEEQGYWLFEPADPHPGTQLATAGPVPVVLFLGGCCAGSSVPDNSSPPGEIQAWLDHLTQRGAIVIYPILRAAHVEEDMAAAMRAAMTELENGGHAQADWTRFATIGFSFGGWYAPVYAQVAATEGLPVPRAIFSTVAFDPETTPDLSAIPASTRVLVLVGDEIYGWKDRGARRLWAALTSVPADHRNFIRLISDTHGTPSLIADHMTPATSGYAGLNALDWYGTWKLGDALMSCAFAEQDCEYALGDTPEQRFMGYWSDGVPVAELDVIDDPGPPDPTTPTT